MSEPLATGLPSRLALATRNDHKVREILRICADWPVEWVTHREASWPEVEETAEGYRDNALQKSRAVAETLGVPAVADDSGIEADALRGAPGPRSARFAGPGATDEANLRLLVEHVREVPEAERTARYRCVAVCSWPEGGDVVAEATCEGRLVLAPRGTRGFGYDPIFVPEGDSRTMAELSDEEKDALSHRGRAFRALRSALTESVR